MIGSERLHSADTADWHERAAPRAARITTAPVPFLSVYDDEPSLHVSVMDGGAIAEAYSVQDASDLPPEIAALLFGAKAS